MTRLSRLPRAVRENIEQAIARGLDNDHIAALGHDPHTITAVRDNLDAIAAADEHNPDLAARSSAPLVDEFNRRYCGTHAAYQRHKARGEAVDVYCANAERKYQRDNYRQRRCAPA